MLSGVKRSNIGNENIYQQLKKASFMNTLENIQIPPFSDLHVHVFAAHCCEIH